MVTVNNDHSLQLKDFTVERFHLFPCEVCIVYIVWKFCICLLIIFNSIFIKFESFVSCCVKNKETLIYSVVKPFRKKAITSHKMFECKTNTYIK